MAIEAAEAAEPQDVQPETEHVEEQQKTADEKPEDEAEAKPDGEEKAADLPDDAQKVDEKPQGVTVTLGEEEPPPPQDKAAKAWAMARQERREQAKRIRELEERLAQASAPATEAAPTLPPEPTLSGCDYDEGRLKAELVKWYEAKRKVDDHAARLKAQAEQQAKEWEATKATFTEKRAKLAEQAPDYEDAEIEVARKFSQTQQAMLMEALDNAPLVVLALHRSPEKLEELAAIKSPAKFTAALARFEGSIKVMSKEAPKPKAEKRVNGGAESSSSASLERALKRARETGDYSDYHKLKRAHEKGAGKV